MNVALGVNVYYDVYVCYVAYEVLLCMSECMYDRLCNVMLRMYACCVCICVSVNGMYACTNVCMF